MNDDVNHPSHYDFGQMEAREIIELAIADIPDPVTAYHVATTLKYFLRTSRKGGTEDIAKGCKHAGWALDAAKAHDIRKLRDVPRPHYDPDSVAFRHGDIDVVCGLSRDPREILEEIAANANKAQQGAIAGEFTQPPNCTHPMHAVALEMADAKPQGAMRRIGESEWEVTWPWDASGESCWAVTRPSEAAGRARLELIHGIARASAEADGRAYPNLAAAQTEYQTLVGN